MASFTVDVARLAPQSPTGIVHNGSKKSRLNRGENDE
jgi:hypothetical protein